MTAPPLLLPVVEGEGETFALPVLLRRICSELHGVHHVEVRKPWRVPRAKMVKPNELQRVASVLSTVAGRRRGGLLVLLDLDDDACPVTLARAVTEPLTVDSGCEVIVACREFEAWFLAAARSLRGHRSITEDASFDGDPEAPRDAKGRLRSMMIEPYRETLHQAAFAGSMDLVEAQDGSRSFRRLVSATGRLVGRPDTAQPS